METFEINPSWWASDNETLLASLKSTPAGLTIEEARHRLKMIGPNELAKKESVPIFKRLLRKLLNPLIILLLIAGFLSAVLGQISDFIIISVITLISVALIPIRSTRPGSRGKIAEKRIAYGYRYTW